MKNNYRKLKCSVLLQTVFVAALSICAGWFLLEYVFSDVIDDLLKTSYEAGVNPEVADTVYFRFLRNNQNFFLFIGFLALFSIFFYIAITKMEKYLRQIEIGIKNITSESQDIAPMIPELKPIEDRLRNIKYNLQEKEREAQLAEKKKNDLVVYLAHDLKTPLTSVLAYLTMLDSCDNMSEEERKRCTHIALEKALRLEELINEFFDITKLNLQDIILEKRKLNISMMLEQMADEFYGVFQGKNLLCKLEMDEEIVIEGDADKLARVFENLLRNAISYCYANSKIVIQAKKTETGCQIIFSNKGEQIPEEKLESIFEKFYRLDEARRSKTGGTGLGLSIAKRIVELHNGKIYAESQNDETRFVVELPKY